MGQHGSYWVPRNNEPCNKILDKLLLHRICVADFPLLICLLIPVWKSVLLDDKCPVSSLTTHHSWFILIHINLQLKCFIVFLVSIVCVTPTSTAWHLVDLIYDHISQFERGEMRTKKLTVSNPCNACYFKYSIAFGVIYNRNAVLND
jgi:hypothetical protein